MDISDAQGRLRGRSPIAVVDIGSNSVRLVIYEGQVRSPATLFNEKVSCGLGRGIASTGRMDDEAVEKAIGALKRYRALAEQAGVDTVHVLATAAAREASNGPDFVSRAEQVLGVPVMILSGKDEARFSAEGVLSAFRHPNGIAGDLGGGSLELVDVADGQIGDGTTLKLGGIRLQERAEGSLKKADEIAGAELVGNALVEAGRSRTFFAVGGTWRNIAKLHMEAAKYPLRVTHAYNVEAEEMIRFCEQLTVADVEKVKGIHLVSRSRRQLLPFGAIVLAQTLKAMRPQSVFFSALGVREGFLFAQLPEEVRALDGLIDAADELAILRSRSPQHARELGVWTGASFKAFGVEETADEERYRVAACRLADIGWRAHPDYRSTQSLAIIAYSSFVQIDHQGRAFIALANYFRYEGLKNESLAPEIRKLTDERIWYRAKLLGAFLRVAYLFTASMPGIIERLGWSEADDGTMLLEVPENLAHLMGERPQGRLSQLSKVTERRISVRLIPG
ncbi:MAG: Ppx/GppA phosphatase family protein [Pseudomonadota bacterium]